MHWISKIKLSVTCWGKMGSSCTQVVHAQAFAFFGGIPCGINLDNSRVLDSNVIGSRQRKLTNRFLQLQSQNLFRAHFYRVARPDEEAVAWSSLPTWKFSFRCPRFTALMNETGYWSRCAGMIWDVVFEAKVELMLSKPIIRMPKSQKRVK